MRMQRLPQLAGGDVDRLIGGERWLGFLPVKIAVADGSDGRRNAAVDMEFPRQWRHDLSSSNDRASQARG
jgi:hypothetical protein